MRHRVGNVTGGIMGRTLKLRQVTGGDDDRAKLCEMLLEAHYLGHSLRALAADPSFRFAEITASIGEPLIAWAKFVDDRLQAGERAFDTAPSPRAGTSARRR
jgi:hypothetical protein